MKYSIQPELMKVIFVIITLILLAMSVGAPITIGWPRAFIF